MKKIFLPLLALLIIVSAVQSQTFQFYRTSPAMMYGDTTATSLVTCKAFYKNTSSTTQNIKFVRVLNSLPGPTWGSSICAVFCYGDDVDTIPPRGQSPISLTPGQSDTLTVDVHGRTPGTATVVIKAFLESNPSGFLTDTFRVQLGPVGIRQISTVVDGYKLDQNYPNPFNPVTKINFSVAKSTNVSLKVYDILGNEVAGLISNKIMKAGSYAYEFDANEFRLSSGVYYYTLKTDDFASTRKMILVK
ncbi:MAG: T9SS type A sorting domain-containing protein [Bacteroidetes bacterium]|nr:T9SS type A sorting domain-containing protein [Bacteroidota bacterium]